MEVTVPVYPHTLATPTSLALHGVPSIDSAVVVPDDTKWSYPVSPTEHIAVALVNPPMEGIRCPITSLSFMFERAQDPTTSYDGWGPAHIP